MRTFALRSSGVAALFFFAFGIAHAEQRTENYPFNSGQRLEVDLKSGGSVSVQGWDQSSVELTVSDRRRDLGDYRFEVTPTDQGLRIAAQLKDRDGGSNLRLELKVPRSLSLDLNSAGGNLELSDLIGRFTGRTGGGAMTLRQLSGEVELRTGGGRIEVTDSTLDGKVGTGGGKVLISNVVGNLQGRSGGGNVVYKNVRSASGDLRSQRGLAGPQADSDTVLIKSQGGRIDVDSAPAGARVETAGGKVRVINAERFIAARTGGGSMELSIGEGWVEAETGAGDIDLTVLRDIAGKGDIDLSTGHGDVTVTLPADFSMDVDIDLGVTKSAGSDPSIRSDFPLQVDESKDWDYSMGSPRRHIRASGKPGGGLHRLKIRATNGNIILRRAQS
ncbi:MAG: DUF4097 family beta strand repeat protein [Xanthomonadales bacterium]|nr:DUF4097 family beta strand repeat protein [Xanthomonadales bacterium]